MERISETKIDKEFAVGAWQGLCLGVSLAIVLLLLGALIPAVWHWSSSSTSPAITSVEAAPQPFVASTVYKNVPFIRLSDEAIRYGLSKPSARRVIEKEMLGRAYFEAEALKGHTKYIPKLTDPGNARSTITFKNGDMEMVVVELINEDGSPGQWGLLPLGELEDDLRSLGR